MCQKHHWLLVKYQQSLFVQWLSILTFDIELWIEYHIDKTAFLWSVLWKYKKFAVCIFELDAFYVAFLCPLARKGWMVYHFNAALICLVYNATEL